MFTMSDIAGVYAIYDRAKFCFFIMKIKSLYKILIAF